MRKNLDITLHLIRHGQTNRNILPLSDLISQEPEEPLNKVGIEQSKKLAARLKKEGIVYNTIYVSPYKRAQETARNILEEAMPKNTNFITVPEICEINQGEGK